MCREKTNISRARTTCGGCKEAKKFSAGVQSPPESMLDERRVVAPHMECTAGRLPRRRADNRREPENWLHRNNSHEVYAAMADHLGIKLTHENKRKMTKIIREALIADYEDNPDECYEWIVQLGLKVDELDIFEYQPWLHRVAQPLEALPSPPLPRQAT